MSGSATSTFGAAPVGSSVQPCPLGVIDVEVVGADGLALATDVRVVLVGPNSLDGVVPAHQGHWSSPKTAPGDYQVAVAPDATIPAGSERPASVSCRLPTSGTATARLVFRKAASLPVRVIRKGTTTPVGGVTIALSSAAHRTELVSADDGRCSFVDLPTSEPGYRIEVTLTSATENRYEAWPPRDLTLEPGLNPSLLLELAPMAEITVTVIDPDSTNRVAIPATVTLTPSGGGDPIELETDPTTGAASFPGLTAGSYALAATPAPETVFTSVTGTTVTIERGATRSVELAAARGRSMIVMSDKAARQGAKGALKNLIITPYPQARDELKKTPVRSSTLLLPFTQLAFDDILFDPDDAYFDDGKEVIAITGWAEAHGVRRQILFAHTYRPNRLILALKFKEWKFDRDWIKALNGPLTRHLTMANAFVALSASETAIRSADLPSGVSSFFGEEELDLKQGVNLYGKLDIKGFPKLEEMLGFMGIEEQYVKVQGWLGHEADFAISKEAIEKKQVHEKAWELALSGSIPGRIPPGARRFITERELTLEIGAKREVKGHGALVHKVAGAVRRQDSKSNQEVEKKIHVKLEDAIKVPLPTLAVPWLIVANEDKDVEFTGAFQLEWELKGTDAKAAGAGKPKEGGSTAAESKAGDSKEGEKKEGGEKAQDKATAEAGAKEEDKGPEITLEYGTDFTIALFAKELAVHDFKAELNFTDNKLKLSGEVDLGRREKVAVVEFERDLGDQLKPPAPAPAAGSGAAETGPATPPKPGLNLEEKQNKPQPEAPTEAELSQASKESGGSTAATGAARKSPWAVTVKLKPSVVMGLVDIVRDIANHIASHQAKP